MLATGGQGIGVAAQSRKRSKSDYYAPTRSPPTPGCRYSGQGAGVGAAIAARSTDKAPFVALHEERF
jgi:hypothetical protein